MNIRPVSYPFFNCPVSDFENLKYTWKWKCIICLCLSLTQGLEETFHMDIF
jgi:hypothetical protein